MGNLTFNEFGDSGSVLAAGVFSREWLADYVVTLEKIAGLFDRASADYADGREKPPFINRYMSRGVISYKLDEINHLGIDHESMYSIFYKIKEAGVMDELENRFRERVFFLTNSCTVRIHHPDRNLELSRLNFHQETATFSYPNSDYTGFVMWVPVEEIDDEMPSLEFVARKFDGVLPHVGNDFSKMIELENHEQFAQDNASYICDARDVDIGSIILISTLTPHRTKVPGHFGKRRISLDLRVAPDSGVPSSYAGSLFRP